jgi:hypothetical protein
MNCNKASPAKPNYFVFSPTLKKSLMNIAHPDPVLYLRDAGSGQIAQVSLQPIPITIRYVKDCNLLFANKNNNPHLL